MLIDRRIRFLEDGYEVFGDKMSCRTGDPFTAGSASQQKSLTASDLYLGPEALVPAKKNNEMSPDVSDFEDELEALNEGLTGDRLLVLLPTGNKQKGQILKAMFPANSDGIVFENLKKVNSGVGEQPYNSAGPEGTMNRIVASLEAFVNDTSPLGSAQSYCSRNNIGKIMVASIENYIDGTFTDSTHSGYQTLEHATDYGFAALYDVTTEEIITAHSDGVKVPIVEMEGREMPVDFVAIAMSQGFEHGNPEHGKQTVGKTIQALVEPSPTTVNSIDGHPYKINANWHADVLGNGMDRYSLLLEAAEEILEQGTKQGMFDV